jgi:cytoskeletal protein CcmA (bactofilin family)
MRYGSLERLQINKKMVMSKDNLSNTVNLLCEGTVIIGDIDTQSDIRIDGIIKGNVTTSGRLVIGNTAKIEGNISCANVDVLGNVLGDISATGMVALKAPAQVKGNISSLTLSIESGVVFNGNCQMTNKGTKE